MTNRTAAQPPGRLGHVTGVVLCSGGAEATHAMRFGEHTLGARMAALLAEIVHDVLWVGAAPPAAAAGRPAAGPSVSASGDETPEQALLAALEAAPGEAVLVVSADRPCLSPDLLIGLAGRPDAPAVVPRDDRGPHLSCARYDAPSVLPVLRRCVAGATAKPFIECIDVVWFEGDALSALDPDGSALERVSSAADLRQLAAGDPRRTRGDWPGHPGVGWKLRGPGADPASN